MRELHARVERCELKLLVHITLGEVMARCVEHHIAEGIAGGLIPLSTHLVEGEGTGLVAAQDRHVHTRLLSSIGTEVCDNAA